MLIEPLGKSHNRADFRCSAEPLERYFQQQAGQAIARGDAAVFVCNDTAANCVVGYYTLSAYTIRLAEVPPDLAKKLPRYPVLPVTLLGRLAVDDRYRGQGFGALLLADALLRAKGNTSRVGSVAVVVNAKDENARGFYERFGFRLLCDAERQLFLPMAMIVEP